MRLGPLVAMSCAGCSAAQAPPPAAVDIAMPSATAAPEKTQPMAPHFVWEVGGPLASDFTSVWGTGPKDVWVVGRDGACAHFDGDRWSPIAVATVEDLELVWAIDEKNVWAADLSAIYAFDGSAMVRAFHSPQELLNVKTFWGTSADDVWAFGGFANRPGVILHFDGRAWERVPFHVVGAVTAIRVVAGELQEVRSSDGDVHRREGGHWVRSGSAPVELPPGRASSAPGWRRGRKGSVFHWERGRWEESWPWPDGPTMFSLPTLFGTGEHAWYARGNDIFSFEGGSWKKQEVPRPRGYLSVKAIWASGPDDVWAVGGDGAVTHFDGSAWKDASLAKAADVTAVAAVGDEVWACGRKRVLRRRRGRWEDLEPPDASTSALYASSDGRVWLGGDHVYEWIGRSFEARFSNMSTFGDIWIESGQVFVASAGGIVTSGGARAPGLGRATLYFGVSGSSPSNVWAVGTQAKALRFDGFDWADVDCPLNGNWLDVWVLDDDRAWLVGLDQSNAILGGNAAVGHFDGQNCTVQILESDRLRAVAGTSERDVWAAGFSGALHHFDGDRWSAVDAGTGVDFRSIAITKSGEVVLAAENGIYVRKP